MEIKTESVLVQNLCVPCGCRCRYCLLSWDGQPVGIDWDRGLAFAQRFRERLLSRRPELRVSFAFGYSMEHPNLAVALEALRALGSPQAEFLQCDGMRLRNESECAVLAEELARLGVKQLNFTLYGLEDYHDRFAARSGDFRGILRMMEAAGRAGLCVSCGLPLTLESAPQAAALAALLRGQGLCERISLFIPHEEGRGVSLAPIRMTGSALEALPPELSALLNRRLYRTEREWVRGRNFVPETKRALLLSLRADTIDRYEKTEPSELIEGLEGLDDRYYAAFPTLEELAERYGDPAGDRLYRQRDLFCHYRRRFTAEFGTRPYDVTDERQSGSRRY